MGDSSVSVYGSQTSQTERDSLQQAQKTLKPQRAADTRPTVTAVPPPAVVYQQAEVTHSHREQPASSSPPHHHHDEGASAGGDDGVERKLPTKGPMVSTTLRDGAELRRLQSQLPDSFHGSGNIKPGSV